MTDTTQTNAHEAAIRSIVRRCPLHADTQRGGWDWMLTDDDVRAILDHAEALARQVAEAEQRAARLRTLYDATPMDRRRAASGGCDAFWDAYYACRAAGDLDDREPMS